MRTLIAPLALATVLFAAPLAVPLHADAQDPQGNADYARDGVRSGEFVRLERLLADAERRYPGRVIEVDARNGKVKVEKVADTVLKREDRWLGQ